MDVDLRHFGFRDEFLRGCTSTGVGAPICVPSGGKARYEHALLDYSEIIEPGKQDHCLVIVFVKLRDLDAYRGRWPTTIFCTLPSDEGVVGCARFWIKAFARQLRARYVGTESKFFERFWMVDDDVVYFASAGAPMYMNVALRNAASHESGLFETSNLVGFHRIGSRVGSEDAVADGRTRPHVVVSVRTVVNAQYHPRAELAEDMDFGMRCLAEAKTAHPGQGTLKLNGIQFYSRAQRQGTDHGAARTAAAPSDLELALVDTMDTAGFDPTKPVHTTGSFPLLRWFHPWGYAHRAHSKFESTRFDISRLEHAPRRMKQGVLHLVDEALLPCQDLPSQSVGQVLCSFLSRLKGVGVVVLPEDAVDFDILIDGRCSLHARVAGHCFFRVTPPVIQHKRKRKQRPDDTGTSDSGDDGSVSEEDDADDSAREEEAARDARALGKKERKGAKAARKEQRGAQSAGTSGSEAPTSPVGGSRAVRRGHAQLPAGRPVLSAIGTVLLESSMRLTFEGDGALCSSFADVLRQHKEEKQKVEDEKKRKAADRTGSRKRATTADVAARQAHAADEAAGVAACKVIEDQSRLVEQLRDAYQRFERQGENYVALQLDRDSVMGPALHKILGSSQRQTVTAAAVAAAENLLECEKVAESVRVTLKPPTIVGHEASRTYGVIEHCDAPQITLHLVRLLYNLLRKKRYKKARCYLLTDWTLTDPRMYLKTGACRKRFVRLLRASPRIDDAHRDAVMRLVEADALGRTRSVTLPSHHLPHHPALRPHGPRTRLGDGAVR